MMDPDACPTTWTELLRIRAENPNYARKCVDSDECGPLRATPENPLFSRTPSPVKTARNMGRGTLLTFGPLNNYSSNVIAPLVLECLLATPLCYLSPSPTNSTSELTTMQCSPIEVQCQVC